jgi:hypothetical protein
MAMVTLPVTSPHETLLTLIKLKHNLSGMNNSEKQSCCNTSNKKKIRKPLTNE